MPNTLLTPLMITREALRILHGKLSFIGNVNRQYDDRFAQDGAKAGQLLNIRMPVKYTVRTGATYTGQDHVERSTPLSVSSQYGVDVSFTTAELTMNIDDLGKRVLEPAMAQLAAKIEGDCLDIAYKRVANIGGTTNASITYRTFQEAGRWITEHLGPSSGRTFLVNPKSLIDFNDATKGLFQDTEAIRTQWREGRMGRTGGFGVYENTFIPGHTFGTLAGSPVTSGAANGTTTTATTWVSQSDVSITGATSTTTLAAGDVITFGSIADGLVEIHPETKASLGYLKRFVVQSAVTMTTAANNYTVTVKPGIMTGTGNAYQNCTNTGADTSGWTVAFAGGAAGVAVGQNLAFHEDAFVFATADLVDVSKYGAWGARATQDGISMRLGRQWSATSDAILTRFDILWGFEQLYPELAARVINQP